MKRIISCFSLLIMLASVATPAFARSSLAIGRTRYKIVPGSDQTVVNGGPSGFFASLSGTRGTSTAQLTFAFPTNKIERGQRFKLVGAGNKTGAEDEVEVTIIQSSTNIRRRTSSGNVTNDESVMRGSFRVRAVTEEGRLVGSYKLSTTSERRVTKLGSTEPTVKAGRLSARGKLDTTVTGLNTDSAL